MKAEYLDRTQAWRDKKFVEFLRKGATVENVTEPAFAELLHQQVAGKASRGTPRKSRVFGKS
jgi:hypothetical protein